MATDLFGDYDYHEGDLEIVAPSRALAGDIAVESVANDRYAGGGEEFVMNPMLPRGFYDSDPIIAKRSKWNLTARSRFMREEFVRQYVLDFNATKAALRTGFAESGSASVGAQLLREPYVQELLHKAFAQMDKQYGELKGRVLARLWEEANDYGMECTAASRVSALRVLTRVLGMEQNKLTLEAGRGTGVMLVPVHDSVDSWEQRAERAQKVLKAEVVE